MSKKILFGTMLAMVTSAGLVWATSSSGCVVSPKFCVTALTRFTTDAQIKIQTPSDGKVQSPPNQAVDVLVQRVEIEPGGYSGWHSHPGQGFVVPTAGEVEIYDGDDPTCTPKIAGVDKDVRSYIEPANHIHYARNVGTVKYEAVATFLLPVGAPSRTDEPSPGNCPF
jgi:hypothetical protein